MTPLPALPRPAGWPERLATYLEERRHMPFGWWDNDCITCAAGGVAAQLCLPLDRLLPGRWRDARSAARWLKKMGGVEAACTSLLGEPVRGRRAAMLGRGAVVCVDAGNGPTLGLMAGNGRWCAPGADGLVWRKAAEVAVGWEV